MLALYWLSPVPPSDLQENQPDFADCLTAFNAAREQAEAKGASKRQRFAVRFPDTAANMAAQMRVAPRLGLSGGKGGDRKGASLIAQ